MKTFIYFGIGALVLGLIFGAKAFACGKIKTPEEYLKASAADRYCFYKELHQRLAKGAPREKLEDRIPGLNANMTSALEVSRKEWTESVNFDSLAKKLILDKKVLKSLGIPFETSGETIHVPAGLMHSYGYLFSQTKTDYGLKGKRWVESRVDERLGLPAGLFSPFAGQVKPGAEFLAELTVELRRLVNSGNPNVTYVGFQQEKVSWKDAEGKIIEDDVRTHFVKLLPLTGFESADTHLLIYEILRKGDVSRFVTAFPVNEAFFKRVSEKPVGKNPEYKPEYNWFVSPSWTLQSHELLGFKTVERND